MPETSDTWIHVVSILFAIVAFVFITSLIDAIHAGVTKLLLWPPSRLLNWDHRDFIPDAIWWKCVVAQFAICVGGWLCGANDDYVSSMAVIATVAILFGFGCAAVNSGSFSKRIMCGFASLLALPLCLASAGLVVFVFILMTS